MSEDECVYAMIATLLTSVVWLLVILTWARPSIDDSWKDQIAGHGCAEYYIDKDYHRQWRWKDQKGETP